MSNLLRADFRRLFKSRTFYICVALMFIAGAVFPLFYYFDMQDHPEVMSFEQYFTDYSVYAVAVLAAFAALFIGTDYSDGTLRNKLIAGNKRACVYLSNLLVQVLVGLILCVAYLVPFLIIALNLIGDMPKDGYSYIAISLAMIVSFAAIFTLAAMLSSSKARSVVLCFVCAVVLLYGGIFVSGRLHEPEFYSTYYTDADGNMEQQDTPNPNYVGGNLRKVLTVVNDVNPGGQAIGVFTMEKNLNAAKLAEYDLALLVLVTGVGMLLFKKKDLK